MAEINLLPGEAYIDIEELEALRARATSAEADAARLWALLADGRDCFAWHTAGCLGDIPGHTCLCGYETWLAAVDAALAADGQARRG